MHITNKIKCLLSFFLVGIILIIPQANSGQEIEQERARLEGTVLSLDKAPIPQAKIQLKHKDSGRMFYSKSNKKGSFLARSLPSGDYIIKVEKEGHKSYSGELKLRPNTTQRIEITLSREETLEQKIEKEAFTSFNNGVKLAKENNFDDAIQEFRKAIELKPDLAEAYENLGILLFQQQKDDEAEKVLLKALELKPEEIKTKQVLTDIYYEKAKTLIRKEKPAEALEKLNQAYSFNPDHAYVNYLLGYLYANNQMKNEAIKHFEAFLQLEPNAPQVEKVKEILKSLKKD